MRMNLGERNAAACRVLLIDTTDKDRRLALKTGMAQKQPGQLGAGITGNANNSGLYRPIHDSSMVLSRDSTSLARSGSGGRYQGIT